MAALGAHPSVRSSLNGADAVLAMVSTARVRAALDEHADALATLVLSAQERILFARAVTMKRKAELLAGRLAAKCVCMTVRRGCDLALPPLAAIDIRREPCGAPLCAWPDGTTQHVSIAHGGAWAMALATIDDAECGIDVEPSSRTLDPAIEEFFHPLERLHIRRQEDARRCWTVRESWGKLTTRGVAADLDRLATVRAAGGWWLAVPKTIACLATVGAGENAAVAIAVAIRQNGNQ